MLNKWLSNANRKLTKDQMSLLMKTVGEIPLPLFLRLTFDQATKWKSYQDINTISLEKNVKDSIKRLLKDLERMHGKYLVAHALGLITCSKYGLSDAEVDDILSIDDEVLNDVYQYWVPPVRRIPSLLWIRIRNDLGSYIVYRGASGVLVNNWYHRQFIETATERYLESAEERLKLHTLLVDYFLGKWSNGKVKPFTNKSGEAGEENRLVAAQPNVFEKREEELVGDKKRGKSGQDSSDVFNYRKLSELPRHLIRSRDLENLCEHVLFNFDFIFTKLCAFGYQTLVEDVVEASKEFPEEKEIKTLVEVLKISSRSLILDPNQFPTQLLGRLMPAKDEEGCSKNIQKLLDQASNSGVKCFLPDRRCFDSPGGSLLHSLAGHTQNVTHVSFTEDKQRLISVAADDTLR